MNVQAPALEWRKARASVNNGQCVELAPLPDGGVAVRDSKNQTGAILEFTKQEWAVFTAALVAGEFDSLG
jgi:uncharacterized protein DUF397